MFKKIRLWLAFKHFLIGCDKYAYTCSCGNSYGSVKKLEEHAARENKKIWNNIYEVSEVK